MKRWWSRRMQMRRVQREILDAEIERLRWVSAQLEFEATRQEAELARERAAILAFDRQSWELRQAVERLASSARRHYLAPPS